MRITVEDLIAELQRINPKAHIEFRATMANEVYINNNHLERIDNFGAKVGICTNQGV